jgi:hypothetical protein
MMIERENLIMGEIAKTPSSGRIKGNIVSIRLLINSFANINISKERQFTPPALSLTRGRSL